MKRVMFCEVG